MINKTNAEEPNMEAAFSWWSEMPDKYTPVGWKDHLFRFNVTFNGCIWAVPNPYGAECTKPWEGEGVSLSVVPVPDINMSERLQAFERDDGFVVQGWNDSPTPVLRSEWTWQGMQFREEVFGRIAGVGDVVTGLEPLYAWVRLSIADLYEPFPFPERYGFAVRINRPNIAAHPMCMRNNIQYSGVSPKYPSGFRLENGSQGKYYLLEDSGKVRLAFSADQDCAVEFKSEHPTSDDSTLFIEMPVKKGAYVDLLVPFLALYRDTVDSEFSLGWDCALNEANTYWSRTPETAARVNVPEEYINATIEHCLKMAEIIAQIDPDTGSHTLLTGSWDYSLIWATPNSMTVGMFLDPLGYHDVVEKYLDIFRLEQGTEKPFGDLFEQHEGYLGAPRRYWVPNFHRWLNEHGSILWAICNHCLLSGHERVIDSWVPTIIKACEFIQHARAITDHSGVPGIMPPAIASDVQGVVHQSCWNDAWMYKSLTTAVKLLQRIDHHRAGEFEREAKEYRQAYRHAFREATIKTPTWTDSEGRVRRCIPASLDDTQMWESVESIYLDAGPLPLVFGGLMDADEPEMDDLREWFRQGPQAKWFRRDSNTFQAPCLVHEMSSCEPCYSWNVFHSWQLGDRHHFLEGMYSLFAGMLSQQTYSVCETRGGVLAVTPLLLPVYLARLAVIDEQLENNVLHLLRLMPLAWLKTDRDCVFENMATEFGPVSLRVRLSPNGKQLQVTFTPRYRYRPSRIVLHIPPVPGLTGIVLNGAGLSWNSEDKTVGIPVDQSTG